MEGSFTARQLAGPGFGNGRGPQINTALLVVVITGIVLILVRIYSLT